MLFRTPLRWSLKTSKNLLLLLCGYSLMNAATAQTSPSQCTWEGVGAEYRVPPAVLYALARVETKLNPAAINRANNNGSVDVGLMQINSIHWPALQKYNIPPSSLLDSCTNLRVGAWVLAQNLVKTKGDLWRAIDLYNPGDKQYRLKVYRELVAIGAIQPVQ